jgi:hypothetical protein
MRSHLVTYPSFHQTTRDDSERCDRPLSTTRIQVVKLCSLRVTLIKWLLRKRHTLETGLLPLQQAVTASSQAKTRFLATRKPKKPGFCRCCGPEAVFSQKNPVSDHPYFWVPVNPRNRVFAVSTGPEAVFSQKNPVSDHP